MSLEEMTEIVHQLRQPPPLESKPIDEIWPHTPGCLLCPFCGGFSELREFRDEDCASISVDGVNFKALKFDVKCVACGATSRRETSKERAITAWNYCGRRAIGG